MKNTKRIITLLIMVAMIIIMIILALLVISHKNSGLVSDETEYGLETELYKQVARVQDKNRYYIVKNIIEGYYYDLTGFNMTSDDVLVYDPDEQDEVEEGVRSQIRAYKNRVYNCLDDEYIKANNVTVENIGEKLGNYKDVVVLINDMYVLDLSEDLQVYFAEGSVTEKSEASKKDKFKMMITVDSQNSRFEIYPNGYKYDAKIGAQLNIDKKEVKSNNFNKYQYELITEDEYLTNMFKDYKDKMRYDTESAYNSLNEEYRKAKFSNQTEFVMYVKNNYAKLISSNLNSYQRKTENDGTRYVLIDNNNNSYIFKETAPMKYDVILDTYTIEIPEFVNKYDKSNEQEKVVLNINKFILAINDKDYKYAYGLIADSFKENNFKTLADFEKYAKKTFFNNNDVSYEKFGDEAGTYYTYDIIIKDKTNKQKNQVNKKMIMLLEEGREFKLSFNI